MPTEREEKPKFPGGSSGRNARDKPAKASSTTAREEKTYPSTTPLMEAVVERSNMLYCSISSVVFNDDLNRRIRNRTSGGVGGRG